MANTSAALIDNELHHSTLKDKLIEAKGELLKPRNMLILAAITTGAVSAFFLGKHLLKKVCSIDFL